MRRFYGVITVFLLSASASAQSNAPCTTPGFVDPTTGSPIAWTSSTAFIYLDPNSFTQAEYKELSNAVSAWNSALAGAVAITLQPFGTAVPPAQTAGAISIVGGSVSNAADGTVAIAQTQGAVQNNATIGATVTFDKSKTVTDPGTGSALQLYNDKGFNAATFFTNVMEHEIGHALGLADYRDSQGHQIDAPSSELMGMFVGQNNNGFPSSAAAPNGIAPGHLSAVGPCDAAKVKDQQSKVIPPPQADGSGGGGGGGSVQPAPVTQDDVPPGEGPGSGSNPDGDGNDSSNESGKGTIIYWYPIP